MTEQSELALRDPARTASRAGVLRAHRAMAAHFAPTPLLPLVVDRRTIWCKAESLQPMGAFKIRGAWHRLSDMSADERTRGVVAFSSGNHAQGVAMAAHKLGVAATIFMPADAPAAKIAGTRAWGAAIRFFDRRVDDRVALAQEFGAQTGAIIVPSFD
ncbi:MAG: pyridoxal-phosphate dependent enzyme, partial [Sphingopyxis sp.]